MPADGYLEFIRDECDRRGILLIFDEIVTGFRIARGGAQEIFGVIPDLSVFSKAIGGGLPLSAFGGSQAVMQAVAANTAKHGGTYNGNPLCAAAALHTVGRLSDRSVLQSLNANGDRIITAIRRAAKDNHVPCVVEGLGGMFQVVFTTDNRPLRHYRDVCRADVARFKAFQTALLEAGIFINSSPLACWFVSTAHGNEEIDLINSAIAKAMAAIS
jgi:glutamate-1-semialdehyde 2,1-aminomutase